MSIIKLKVFTADWCLSCKTRMPKILDDCKKEFSDTVQIEKLDAILNEELAISLDVQHFPTTIFFDENDKELDRFVGVSSIVLMRKMNAIIGDK